MKQKQIIAALLCAVTPLAYAETSAVLDEVVVTAARVAQPLDQSMAHTTVIGQKEIRESQAADIASLLKNLAGVEIYQTGGIGKQSSLFVRGTNLTNELAYNHSSFIKTFSPLRGRNFVFGLRGAF